MIQTYTVQHHNDVEPHVIEGQHDPDLESRIRVQQRYWKQLVQLKVECEYVRHYQTAYRWWVTRIDLAKARQNLMRQMLDAVSKHFPTGLHRREDLFRLAEADAAAYMKATFGTEPS